MEGGIAPAAGKNGAKEKCGFKTTSEEKDGELGELWNCTRVFYLRIPASRDAGTESAAQAQGWRSSTRF